MKTREKSVLVEAKKMIGRIELFKWIYDFSEEFKKDAEKLKDSINKYETGTIREINEIITMFDAFTKKYTKYIDEVLPVECDAKKQEKKLVAGYKTAITRLAVWNYREKNDREFADDCARVKFNISNHELGNDESLQKVKDIFEKFTKKHAEYIDVLKLKYDV